jgi:hypothetical protein
MKVTQIYDLMNSVTEEILGESNLVKEDLSNVVDLGVQIFDATSVDNYVKSLVDHIGKVIFVNRVYSGGAPSVLRDGWEFGAILEKISCDLPDAQENESWSLEDGESYDPNVFSAPKVSAKFYQKRVTFEVQMSFTEIQVKGSLSSAEQLNSFLSMLYNAVEKSMTVKLDALIMRTLNTMTAETIHEEYGSATLASKSTVKAINLLYLYNNGPNAGGTALTASDAMTDPEFIRFAVREMNITRARLAKISTLFNVGGKDRFTPNDMLKTVMLADFKESADVYLQSETFHDEYTRLMPADVVPYWQGSGDDYALTSISAINVTTPSGDDVSASGILAVMFDPDAVGVANLDRRTTTNYNAKAEFYNSWFKMDAGYFADLNENYVVFLVA